MNLPDFPVDPGTLDAIEEAIGYAVPDDRATATATTDDVTDAETAYPAAVGLDGLLELVSGWTPDGDKTIHRGGVIVDVGPLFSREDVILALIQEVRELRALVTRLREGRPIAGRRAR